MLATKILKVQRALCTRAVNSLKELLWHHWSCWTILIGCKLRIDVHRSWVSSVPSAWPCCIKLDFSEKDATYSVLRTFKQKQQVNCNMTDATTLGPWTLATSTRMGMQYIPHQERQSLCTARPYLVCQPQLHGLCQGKWYYLITGRGETGNIKTGALAYLSHCLQEHDYAGSRQTCTDRGWLRSRRCSYV